MLKKTTIFVLLASCSCFGMKESMPKEQVSEKQPPKPKVNLRSIGKKVGGKSGPEKVVRFGNMKFDLNRLQINPNKQILKKKYIKSLYQLIGNDTSKNSLSLKDLRRLTYPFYILGVNIKDAVKNVNDLAFEIAQSNEKGSFHHETSKKVAFRSAQLLTQKEPMWHDSRLVKWGAQCLLFGSATVFSLFFAKDSEKFLEEKVGKNAVYPIMFCLSGIIGATWVCWGGKQVLGKIRLKNQLNGRETELKYWKDRCQKFEQAKQKEQEDFENGKLYEV